MTRKMKDKNAMVKGKRIDERYIPETAEIKNQKAGFSVNILFFFEESSEF